jgi:hypothetical protein
MAFLLVAFGKGKTPAICHSSVPRIIIYSQRSEPKNCPSPRRTNVFTNALDLHNRYYTHVVCFTVPFDFQRSSDRDEMQGWNNIRSVRTRRMLRSRWSRQDRNKS